MKHMALREARLWVWARLLRRAGMATKRQLYAIWDHDPELLDDALRSLRDDGAISYAGGMWYLTGTGPGGADPVG